MAVTLAGVDAQAAVGVVSRVEDTTPARLQGLHAIVSVVDETVELHLLPDVETDLDPVALVITTPAAVEVRPGSLELHDGLRRATLPTFELETVEGTCSAPSGPAGPPELPGATHTSVSSTWPFRVTALSDAQQALLYLDDRGWDTATLADAIPLDQAVTVLEYGTAAQGTQRRFHPVAIRFTATDPALALDVMAAAAGDVVEIDLHVLANGRGVPVELPVAYVDRLRVDWTRRGLDYPARMHEALAVASAERRALVDESFDAVEALDLDIALDARWHAPSYVPLEWLEVVEALNAQGLMRCDRLGPCVFLHPRIEELLETHLHLPPQVDRQSLYRCPECWAESGVLIAWDPVGFAASFAEHVVGAAQRARAVVARASHVTRLAGIVPRDALDFDLRFAVRPDASVSDRRPARMLKRCGGDPVVTLPDGRDVVLPDGQWPDFDGLPPAERIVRFDEHGEEDVVLDVRAAIDEALARHNASAGWPPSSGCRIASATGPSLLPLLLVAARRRRERSAAGAGSHPVLGRRGPRGHAAKRPSPPGRAASTPAPKARARVQLEHDLIVERDPAQGFQQDALLGPLPQGRAGAQAGLLDRHPREVHPLGRLCLRRMCSRRRLWVTPKR